MSKNLNVADAKRYRITYNGDKIYVSLSYEARELFISSIADQNDKIAAIYDSLTRMISMAWQNNSTEDIIKQLKKASRSKNDLPGMLTDLIEKEVCL